MQHGNTFGARFEETGEEFSGEDNDDVEMSLESLGGELQTCKLSLLMLVPHDWQCQTIRLNHP